MPPMPQAEQLIAEPIDLDRVSRALQAMSHPLRLKILCMLGETEEIHVQGIVNLVGSTQSNISQHLSSMREKGVLISRREANHIYYRISDPRMVDLIALFRDVFCGFAD